MGVILSLLQGGGFKLCGCGTWGRGSVLGLILRVSAILGLGSGRRKSLSTSAGLWEMVMCFSGCSDVPGAVSSQFLWNPEEFCSEPQQGCTVDSSEAAEFFFGFLGYFLGFFF